jgi:hypothetical protein
MDIRRDGVEPPHESRYATLVAEAAVREAALQQQVGYLSEQLAASARYAFSPIHCLCLIFFELTIFHFSVAILNLRAKPPPPTSLNKKEKNDPTLQRTPVSNRSLNLHPALRHLQRRGHVRPLNRHRSVIVYCLLNCHRILRAFMCV